MSSFNNLLKRMSYLTEARDSPMERILPGFQTQARAYAASKGASSGTREGRLAMLNILFELDIIDMSVVKQFKNDPSVSRMVDYLEQSGVSKVIKQRENDIREFIKNQLENKISFTTGNRSNAAAQKYEINKLNNELKAAKKAAKQEGKKETEDAVGAMKDVVTNYSNLVDSIKGSYSKDYMIEVVANPESGLAEVARMVKYLTQFVDEDDIDVDGRSLTAEFSPDTKLGRIIAKMGAGNVEKSIAKDLKQFGGAGVVVYDPDKGSKEDMLGSLKVNYQEDEESDPTDELGPEDVYGPKGDVDYGTYSDEEAEDEDKEFPMSGSDEEQVKQAQLNALMAAYKGNKKKLTTENYTAIYMDDLLTEKFNRESLKRTGRGLAAAAGIAGAAAGIGHVAPKAIQSGKELVSDVISVGDNEDFLSQIRDERDRQLMTDKLAEVRSMGTQAEIAPGSKLGSLENKRQELYDLEQQMRIKYNIPGSVHIQEQVDSTTAMYLTEQVKTDNVKRPTKQETVSFKEKYKPKTIQQLQELRRYGL